MNVPIAKAVGQSMDRVNAADIIHKEKITPEIYYTSLKYFAMFTQFLSWPFALIFFHIFFDVKIMGQENIKKISSPFIIIANHITFYDSFAFRLILGLFTTKLPFRFMAVKKFDNFYLNILAALWIIDIVYAIFGVFVIEPGKGMSKNLEEAQRIIKNGGNVVVYPEGSIISSGKIEEFKLGAAVLAQKTGVPVLPISMRLGKKRFLNTEFIINVGNIIDVSKDVSAREITNDFERRVVDLYDKVYNLI